MVLTSSLRFWMVLLVRLIYVVELPLQQFDLQWGSHYRSSEDSWTTVFIYL